MCCSKLIAYFVGGSPGLVRIRSLLLVKLSHTVYKVTCKVTQYLGRISEPIPYKTIPLWTETQGSYMYQQHEYQAVLIFPLGIVSHNREGGTGGVTRRRGVVDALL